MFYSRDNHHCTLYPSSQTQNHTHAPPAHARVHREKLRKTKGAGTQLGMAGAGAGDEDDEEDGGRLPLGRQGQPLALDVDAPTEVKSEGVGGSGFVRHVCVGREKACDVVIE